MERTTPQRARHRDHMTWKWCRKSHNDLKRDRPALELARTKRLHRLIASAERMEKKIKDTSPAVADNYEQFELINEGISRMEKETKLLSAKTKFYQTLLTREDLVRTFTKRLSSGPSDTGPESTALCLRRIITRSYAAEVAEDNYVPEKYVAIPDWKLKIIADKLRVEVQNRLAEFERKRQGIDPD